MRAGGEEAVEGTFHSKGSLFSNRVYRIYRRVGVDMGFDSKSNQSGTDPAYLAPPQDVEVPAPRFGRPKVASLKERVGPGKNGRPATSQLRVLNAVRRGFHTRPAIAREAGLTGKVAQMTVWRMVKLGRLMSTGTAPRDTLVLGPNAWQLGGE